MLTLPHVALLSVLSNPLYPLVLFEMQIVRIPLFLGFVALLGVHLKLSSPAIKILQKVPSEVETKIARPSDLSASARSGRGVPRLSNTHLKMGRGVSSGGGQSSLGYLFGSNDSAKPVSTHTQPVQNPGSAVTGPPSKPTAVPSKPHDNASQVPAGVAGMHETTANNYFRADGQNCGNFITDRPSTKVHSAPGGGSSLGYLFGGNN